VFVGSASSPADLGFIHRFVPAERPGYPPLLLLHGTGGDEDDLVPLGARLAPGAALLSPRGKVLENGMPRFFRRLAEGVFDLDDLVRRTHDLADFVLRAQAAYSIKRPMAVGFSNGANTAAAMLMLRPEILSGAILMRTTVPLEPERSPNLTDVPVLILSGTADPMVAPGKPDHLARLLADAGADVTHETLPAGHGLTAQDVALATAWLSSRAKMTADPIGPSNLS
jgi:phospholipase/carboxylesterase